MRTEPRTCECENAAGGCPSPLQQHHCGFQGQRANGEGQRQVHVHQTYLTYSPTRRLSPLQKRKGWCTHVPNEVKFLEDSCDRHERDKKPIVKERPRQNLSLT